MGVLVLRPLRAGDEEQAEAAHRELAADGFAFLLERELVDTFDAYLALRARRAAGEVPSGWVLAAFLAAEVDGDLVGRTSIRFALTDSLRREGGHVGYGVRPAFRRRGYATEMLRQSLLILSDRGIDQALVTCDDDNVGSARTIERCGGVFDDVVHVDHGPVHRYWVPTGPIVRRHPGRRLPG